MGRRKKQPEEDIEPEEEVAEEEPASYLHGDAKRSIGAVVLFAFALLFILGFIGVAGPLGGFLDRGVGMLFGWGKWISPVVLVVTGVFLLGRRSPGWSEVIRYFGLFIAFAGLLGFLHAFFGVEDMYAAASAGRGGGLLGFGLAYIAMRSAGSIGGVILLIMFFLVGVIAAFNVSLIAWIEGFRSRPSLGSLFHWDQAATLEEEMPEGFPEEEPLDIPDERPEHGDGSEDDETDGIAVWEEEESEARATGPVRDLALEKANIASLRFPDEERAVEAAQALAESQDHAEEMREIPLLIAKTLKKKPKKKKWILPGYDLVDAHVTEKPKQPANDVNAQIIQETLRHFGIEVELGSVQVGPTVTQYTFRPAMGVKLSRITTLNNDLALALSASSIRIEAPIPGKALVGIEVPNRSVASVRFRNLLESREVMSRRQEPLLMVLGKDVSDEVAVTNLDKLPHLLIAGTTGSGKSVCINVLLLSLLYRNTPDDLQLILVDPKRVELTPYNKIPHLKTDVIVEPKKVVSVLRWAVGEMERRYKVLETCQSRDINSYRTKRANGGTCTVKHPETGVSMEETMDVMPYIVIVIDEMADLMMAHGKDVEGLIVRLAQMSRAVGIHLILATQRPSVEVITGLIKANIIARIAFQVATQIDSRTILDMGGADKLLGRGDMLFLSPTAPQPRRMQGVFVSEEEVRRVTDFWRVQAADHEGDIPESFETKKSEDSESGENGVGLVLQPKLQTADADPFAPDVFDLEKPAQDERYEEAKQFVIESGKASASLLQRRMSVGYARAARILDELEQAGIIGPADGAKARAIYVGPHAKSGGQPVYDDDVADQTAREKWE